jgi:hypothetical protein
MKKKLAGLVLVIAMIVSSIAVLASSTDTNSYTATSGFETFDPTTSRLQGYEWTGYEWILTELNEEWFNKLASASTYMAHVRTGVSENCTMHNFCRQVEYREFKIIQTCPIHGENPNYPLTRTIRRCRSYYITRKDCVEYQHERLRELFYLGMVTQFYYEDEPINIPRVNMIMAPVQGRDYFLIGVDEVPTEACIEFILAYTGIPRERAYIAMGYFEYQPGCLSWYRTPPIDSQSSFSR